MNEQNSHDSSAGRVAATGGMLLVIFRLFAELSSCAGPARALTGVGKIAGAATKISAAGRGARVLAEASGAARGLGGAGKVVAGTEGLGRVISEASAASRAARGAGELGVVGEDLVAARAGVISSGTHGAREAASGAHTLGEEGSSLSRGGASLPRARVTAGLPRSLTGAEMRARILAGRTLEGHARLLSAAEEPTTGSKVLSFVPDSEEAFRNVFKAPFTVVRRREMERYGRLFRKLGNSEVVTSSRYDSEALFAYISENPNSNSIIIVGHSEEANAGRALLLPNGERVSVERIHEMCLASNSRCLVLTCFGEDFRLTGQISMKEAYYMTRRGVDVAAVMESRPMALPARVRAALGDGSLTQTDLMIEAMRSERVVRKAGKVSIAAAGVGTGAVLYKVAGPRGSRH